MSDEVGPSGIPGPSSDAEAAATAVAAVAAAAEQHQLQHLQHTVHHHQEEEEDDGGATQEEVMASIKLDAMAANGELGEEERDVDPVVAVAAAEYEQIQETQQPEEDGRIEHHQVHHDEMAGPENELDHHQHSEHPEDPELQHQEQENMEQPDSLKQSEDINQNHLIGHEADEPQITDENTEEREKYYDTHEEAQHPQEAQVSQGPVESEHVEDEQDAQAVQNAENYHENEESIIKDSAVAEETAGTPGTYDQMEEVKTNYHGENNATEQEGTSAIIRANAEEDEAEESSRKKRRLS